MRLICDGVGSLNVYVVGVPIVIINNTLIIISTHTNAFKLTLLFLLLLLIPRKLTKTITIIITLILYV